jgi:hypothetical protein
VQPLGTGIALDRPLATSHAINAVVSDSAASNAGYEGTTAPNQWFGGPVFTSVSASSFTPTPPTLTAGSMVLRDAAGLVVDSINYGSLVDPWAAEGYQAVSGSAQSGCFAPAPGAARSFGPQTTISDVTNRSAGRFPDGFDTDGNCNDFLTQPATNLLAASAAGATNIKVGSVADFAAGQTIKVDSGASRETAVIATVGTAGATVSATRTTAGVTVIPVAGLMGFSPGQAIEIDTGANHETAVVASTNYRGGAAITVNTPLTVAHAAGVEVSGTGITITAPLAQAHASGAPVISTLPTPGAPNQYLSRRH